MSEPRDDAGAGDQVEEIEPGPGEPPPVPKAEHDDAGPLSVHPMPPRAWPPKTLGDLMSRKVITLREDEPIGQLEAWMQSFRFHHLPVVTAETKLVGLITRTDLLHAMLGVGPAGQTIERADEKTLAGAIMRRGVVTGTPETDLATACRVMLDEKLGSLPVVLADGTLVGITTLTDFATVALSALERA